MLGYVSSLSWLIRSHISTINSNVLLIVLLLHQSIFVFDALDMFGRPVVMRIAYKGFPLCFDVFLRWNARFTAPSEL